MSKKRTTFYDFKSNIDFDLPSRKQLEKRLGDDDVLAEYTICALRDFQYSVAHSGINKKQFFKERIMKHKINMGSYVEYNNMEHDLCMLFMINSYAMLNEFIIAFRDDIRDLIKYDFKLSDKEGISKVEKLNISLEEIGIKSACPIWILQCLNYYRYVRNATAHNDGIEIQCDEAYKLIDIKQIHSVYPTFKDKAPNPVNHIKIDDFYFYSACIKHYANYLVMALKGKVDWANIGQTHHLFQRKNIPKGTNPMTWVNGILTRYNCHATQAVRDQIVEYIKANK